MEYWLLTLSIVLATGRNLLSKNLSGVRFRTGRFFLCQGVLFLSGGVALLAFGGIRDLRIAAPTVILAAVYGVLLLLAQWFYTVALAGGNTALCATVYPLGFILPTLSGAILWDEAFTLPDFFGILCAVAAVVVSGLRTSGVSVGSAKKASASFLLPLTVAMLSSGGVGIVQKIQQKSAYADQRSIFLLLAFLLAAAVSLLFALLAPKRESTEFSPRKYAVASCTGAFFGCCNLLNTFLAGRLDSVVFFPTVNLGTIALTLVCGVFLLREKLRAKEITVLVLVAATVLLLTL